MRHGIDYYWIQIQNSIIPLYYCTMEILQSTERDKIPEETLQIAYLLTKIYSWEKETIKMLNDEEIKLFFKLIEGCKLCSQYQNCPYTNITTGNQAVRNTFRPSEKTQLANDRMIAYLNSLLKEN